jgi:hypothetical protein
MTIILWYLLGIDVGTCLFRTGFREMMVNLTTIGTNPREIRSSPQSLVRNDVSLSSNLSQHLEASQSH